MYKAPNLLFRGKSIKSGKYVTGYYLRHDTVKVCFTGDDPKTVHYIVGDGFCDWGFEPPLNFTEVDPDTIQMYRGEHIWNGERKWGPISVERVVRDDKIG